MAKAYSMDLRERALKDCDAGTISLLTINPNEIKYGEFMMSHKA